MLLCRHSDRASFGDNTLFAHIATQPYGLIYIKMGEVLRVAYSKLTELKQSPTHFDNNEEASAAWRGIYIFHVNFVYRNVTYHMVVINSF